VITYISLIALAGAIWWLVDRQRPQLDAAAAQRWEAFYGYSTAHHLQMLYIQRVYQRAQTGSKAYVSVYNDPTSAVRDAWFWWTQVQQGSVVAVQPSEGWGPHTGRDDVLFVGAEQSRQPAIYAAVDAKTLRRARRHRQQYAVRTSAA
jgi:hypothetical protein